MSIYPDCGEDFDHTYEAMLKLLGKAANDYNAGELLRLSDQFQKLIDDNGFRQAREIFPSQLPQKVLVAA